MRCSRWIQDARDSDTFDTLTGSVQYSDDDGSENSEDEGEVEAIETDAVELPGNSRQELPAVDDLSMQWLNDKLLKWKKKEGVSEYGGKKRMHLTLDVTDMLCDIHEAEHPSPPNTPPRRTSLES